MPVSNATVGRVAAAYREIGSPGAWKARTAIMSATGLSRWTVESALIEAKRRGALDAAPAAPDAGPDRPQSPEFTPPVLPAEDEDLETTILRLEAEQVRREAYRAAAEWMRFDVTGDEPFALAFVGDPHADVCDIARLRRHVDLIQATPRFWAIGLGDWLNGWVGRLRGEYAHQSVTERQAYSLARWLLNRPIWWLLLLGNHDGQRWHGQGSPLRWMENAAAVPVQEWACKFSIGCGGRVWRVSAAHNFPGASQFNPNHGPKKRALWTGGEADIFVAGDRHTFALEQNQHEHTGRVFWTARARGYKPLDHYALEHGHGDAGGPLGTGHSIGAVFDPRDGSVVCFAELDKAAGYLGYLRASRGAKAA
jgi:hypothetical protein